MRDHRLEHLADEAVAACSPLLPLEGSWTTGYTVAKRVDTTLIATPEEWATAAHAIAELHAVLRAREQVDNGK